MRYILLVVLVAACDSGGTPPGFALDVAALGGVWPRDDGVVNTATPTVRWTPVAGAVRYEVSIRDDAGALRESFDVAGTTYVQTSQPLQDRQVAHLQIDAFDANDAPLSTVNSRFMCIALPDWLQGALTLVARDPARTIGGYRLFNMIDIGERTIPVWVLVDSYGQVVWWYRYPEVGSAEDCRVLDNGNLLLVVRGSRDAQGRFPWNRGVEITWDGTIVWESRTDIFAHHEMGPGPNGMRMYLTWVYRDLGGETIEADGIEIVDPATDQLLWEWNMFDHVDFSSWPTAGLQDTFTGHGLDWSHSNAVVWDAARSLIWVSVRHFDALLAIDYPSGNIRHILGKNGIGGDGLISHQHAPEIQADGSILLWDNGNSRATPESRAVQLQVDLVAGTVRTVWEWKPDLYDFAVGDADRLPNDNIQVVAGVSGRIIEVTRAGETVWEQRVAPRWWHYRAEYVPASKVPASVKPFGN